MTTRVVTPGRSMRTERMVMLRSSMPVQLVTLRHSVPLHLSDADLADLAPFADDYTTTPEVDEVETAAGKGGDAR